MEGGLRILLNSLIENIMKYTTRHVLGVIDEEIILERIKPIRTVTEDKLISLFLEVYE